MLVPRMLFGTGKEVHAPVGRLMKKAKKSMSWPESLESEMIDSREIASPESGVKVFFQIDPTLGGRQGFRTYALYRYFPFTRTNDSDSWWSEMNFLFDNLVTSTWGLLAILGKDGFVPRMDRDPARSRLFFERLVKDWEKFINERHLFEENNWRSPKPVYFWNSVQNQLWSALVESGGLPQELLTKRPLHELDDYQAVRWINEYILK